MRFITEELVPQPEASVLDEVFTPYPGEAAGEALDEQLRAELADLEAEKEVSVGERAEVSGGELDGRDRASEPASAPSPPSTHDGHDRTNDELKADEAEPDPASEMELE